MPSLLIPKTGLSLDSSSAKGGPEAYNVTIPDNVIEDMIKCVRNGKGIQLSLGPNPVFSYGNNEQHFAYNEDTFTTELYRSELDPNNTSTSPKMPIFNSKHSIFQMKRMVPTARPPSSTPAATTDVTSAVTAGADSALATLQNSMAKETAKKSNNTIKYIKDGSGLPPPVQKKGPAKAISNTKRFLSGKNQSLGTDTTRSMPTSPALSGVGSPSLAPTSNGSGPNSIRSTLVHELAVGPLTEQEFSERTGKSPSEFLSTLDKVADVDGDKYKLRNKCYKELNVFKYPYESHALRETAIANAIKAFDKLRMGTGEPEWELLLPVKERGTGKCLSKLQSKIAETAEKRSLPKPAKVLKASKSPNPQAKQADTEEDVAEKLSPKKVDNRSTSQPPVTNKKRVSEKEAQAKRLLSKPTKAQASKQKSSASQEKFKSSEFVNDSDESDDYLQPPAPAPAPAAPAPTKKAVSTPQPTPISHSKSAKRVRDDDMETPAVKKSKKAVEDAEKAAKHRMSDASRTSQSTNASSASLTSSASAASKKTTSPQKSSPLASSPANASDIDAAYTTSTSSDRSPDGTKTQHHQKVLHGRVTKTNVRDRGLQWKRDWKDYIRLREELVAFKVKNKEFERKCIRLRDMYTRLAKEKEGFWRDYRASS